MKDEENLAMIVKFVKYLIDKDVLDKQYEEDSIYGLTIMLEKIVAYVVLFCIAFIVRKPIDGIIFTVSFMAVRQTTGGFHAKVFGMSDRISINIINGIRNNCSVNRKV